jgi:UDP-N-acetylmuramyl pentapeptide synthase
MIYISDFTNCSTFISSKETDAKEVLINTDSRTLASDETFLAITGYNYNALSFLDSVVKSGCSTVIYTKTKGNDLLIKNFESKINFVATTDSIKFLQQITNILSNRFQENGGKLIAISG